MAKKIDDVMMLKALIFPIVLIPAIVLLVVFSATKAAFNTCVDETRYAVRTWLRWWREC